MDRQTSTLRLPLHPDIVVVAQCRRGLLRQPRQETAQARRVPIPAGAQRCHPPLPRRNQRTPKALYLDQGSEQNYRRRQARAPSVRFDPLAHAAGLTLDGYCKSTGIFPSFLKIDVEGYEVAVLRGAQGMLSRLDRPALVFEYYPDAF